MLVASWNVNSINARLSNVLAWLKEQQPDVLLMQELKCTEDKFPVAAFQEAGYEYSAIYGQKSWNGVAIVSKIKIENITLGLPGDKTDEQARYIEATIRGVRFAAIYLPNGNPVDSEKYPYKLKWCDRLIARAQDLLTQGLPVILGGDFNIIPEARDCHDPAAWQDDALFRLESRQKLRMLLNLGYTDAFRACNDKDHQYTFWDYQGGSWQRNNGIRIDHILLSPQAADALEDCTIDTGPRGEEKASDHTPIVAKLRI